LPAKPPRLPTPLLLRPLTPLPLRPLLRLLRLPLTKTYVLDRGLRIAMRKGVVLTDGPFFMSAFQAGRLSSDGAAR
ncbi:MAG TPA: hypothetical protein PL098_01585, partial [Brevundimonas diminuta]|nr:hypothetical protein [Brevundimonas diminuta]HRL23907.1 hypothetical protein [Brevundimonas diminuta]